jgi:hypothetical protein
MGNDANIADGIDFLFFHHIKPVVILKNEFYGNNQAMSRKES